MCGPKKTKIVLWPDNFLELVCIHKLTLGVTWAGSLLATPLPIGVQRKKVLKKRNFQIMLVPYKLDP